MGTITLVAVIGLLLYAIIKASRAIAASARGVDDGRGSSTTTRKTSSTPSARTIAEQSALQQQEHRLSTSSANFLTPTEWGHMIKTSELGPLAKITINYFQILYYIGRFTINWDSQSSTYFDLLSIAAISFRFFSFQCSLQEWSFYDRLTMIYLLPLVCLAVFGIIFGVAHLWYRKTFKDSYDDWQHASMLVLFLIHPTLLLEVGSSMPCTTIQHYPTCQAMLYFKFLPKNVTYPDDLFGEVTQERYLIADTTISCDSGQYHIFRALSITYIIVYIFGLPLLLYFRGLRHNYRTGKLHKFGTPANLKYSFFVRGFRRDAYYWEAVIMLRKLCMAALSLLRTEALQLVYGNVIVVVAFVVNLFVLPFTQTLYNLLEGISLIILYFAMILGFHATLSDSSYNYSFAVDSGQEHKHHYKLWPAVLLIFITISWGLFLVCICVTRLPDLLSRHLSKFVKQRQTRRAREIYHEDDEYLNSDDNPWFNEYTVRTHTSKRRMMIPLLPEQQFEHQPASSATSLDPSGDKSSASSNMSISSPQIVSRIADEDYYQPPWSIGLAQDYPQ